VTGLRTAASEIIDGLTCVASSLASITQFFFLPHSPFHPVI